MSNSAVAPMPNNGADIERGGGRSRVPSAMPTRPPAFYPGRGSAGKWMSWFVPAMMVANVVMFVVTMGVNDCPAHQNPQGACVPAFFYRISFQPLQENPLLGPSSSTLEKLGALGWDKVVNQHQGWRLVTSLWLHAGFIHLVVNVISTGFIGILLEQNFGFERIGIIYLISGLGGSALSSLFLRNSISVAASAPLFGLLGATLSDLTENYFLYTDKALALLVILLTIVVNAAVGIVPRVNNLAHIGGFLTGFCLGFPLMIKPRYGRHNLPGDVRVKSKYSPLQYAFSAISMIVLIFGFAYVVLMLFTGQNGNDLCSWCHYLNCVPASIWSCSS